MVLATGSLKFTKGHRQIGKSDMGWQVVCRNKMGGMGSTEKRKERGCYFEKGHKNISVLLPVSSSRCFHCTFFFFPGSGEQQASNHHYSLVDPGHIACMKTSSFSLSCLPSLCSVSFLPNPASLLASSGHPITNDQQFPAYRNMGLLSQWDKDLGLFSQELWCLMLLLTYLG